MYYLEPCGFFSFFNFPMIEPGSYITLLYSINIKVSISSTTHVKMFAMELEFE